MFSKLLLGLFGKKDAAHLESLRFHYEHHLYGANRFKEVMRGLHTVAAPEVTNEHGAVIGGAYFCTREQLMLANGERHADWGPFPESLTGATFVVQPDCSIRFNVGQLYPVVATAPAPRFRFEDTLLNAGALAVIFPKSAGSLAGLLSAARSEYLHSSDTAGPFMSEVTMLFLDIATKTYDGDFVWSEYNLKQWKHFVASKAASAEGGSCVFSCVFSCEHDGGYDVKSHDTFKALFLGVPTGMHPYSVSVRDNLATMDTPALRTWITANGHPTV